MNFQKTDQDIKTMKKAGEICAQALKKVLDEIRPGVSLKELDEIAESEIKKQGASAAFKTVDNYAATICTTVNEQVVHGIPTDRILKDGDIVGIDIGAFFQGFHSDLAITVPVGKIKKETGKFLEVGQKTLNEAIQKARIGNTIGDISQTIQNGIETAGYSVVTSLTGHGIGSKLHEDPMVPGVGKRGTGAKILKNMTLAIEVIYTQGLGEVVLEKDGWTISSADGSLGGLFEKTVAIGQNGPIVLTPYI